MATKQPKPLCIDLYCGLGGWAEGFLAADYDVIGFDIERHDYGSGGYPGQLVLQDVLTLHGSQFRDAACIVASPPCQEYSYMAMPWKRAKAKAEAIRADKTGASLARLNALFDACFRIQREASVAAGRDIPLVVENVKGAQPWVGRARWHFGSFYLWGDVPALMPSVRSWVKCGGRGPREVGIAAADDYFHTARELRPIKGAIKNNGGSWFAVANNTESGHGRKQEGSGPIWFDTGIAHLPSSSPRRKAASALIAKIPFPLAYWIAECYRPVENSEVCA